MREAAPVFARDRYIVLPALLTEPSLSQVYLYACKLSELLSMLNPGDEQVPGTPCCYGDFIMDSLLTNLLPEIERASGLSLFPAYSYYRMYKHGDTLPKHRDRASCEISITLCLGVEGGKPWPILIEGPNGRSSVSLQPGDALLYRGTECKHWREMFEGERQAQVFLHYVDQNGPHTEWKFDKRESTTGIPRNCVVSPEC